MSKSGLYHSIGGITGHIADYNPSAGSSLQINIVDPGSGLADEPELRGPGHQFIVHRDLVDHQNITVPHPLQRFFPGAGMIGDKLPEGADLVQWGIPQRGRVKVYYLHKDKNSYFCRMKDFKSQTISLENVINARELGGFETADGHKIRHGLLLRGARLSEASDADLQRLSEVYKLRRIFDFRMESEVLQAPDRGVDGAEYCWLPAMDPQTCESFNNYIAEGGFTGIEDVVRRGCTFPSVKQAARTLYTSLVESSYTQDQYAKFMRGVLDTTDGAIYWHCTQGKDRTGLASAFILSALGADRETILEDYNISNEFYREDVAKMTAIVRANGGGDEEVEVVKTFIGANKRYFAAALDRIDEISGSMDEFLASRLGIGKEERQTLRLRYLE